MNSNSIKMSPEDIHKDIDNLKKSETKNFSEKIHKSIELFKLYSKLSCCNIGTKSNK